MRGQSAWGMPSIRDRVAQEAVRMALEPIYEADFLQCSYGFRPNRCTMDAIDHARWYTQESLKYFESPLRSPPAPHAARAARCDRWSVSACVLRPPLVCSALNFAALGDDPCPQTSSS